jgi:hypothetical protein
VTVADLIRRLADYPPKAEIILIGLEEPWLVDKLDALREMRDNAEGDDQPEPGEAPLAYTERMAGERSLNMLYIDAEPDRGYNPYRAGALEQLLEDEVCRPTNECEHGINREDGCPECEMRASIIEAGGDPLRNAVEEHLSQLLEDASAWATAKLTEPWPDPSAIRIMMREQFDDRFDSAAYEATDMPTEVCDDPGLWTAFEDIVMERANTAARKVRGR